MLSRYGRVKRIRLNKDAERSVHSAVAQDSDEHSGLRYEIVLLTVN